MACMDTLLSSSMSAAAPPVSPPRSPELGDLLLWHTKGTRQLLSISDKPCNLLSVNPMRTAAGCSSLQLPCPSWHCPTSVINSPVALNVSLFSSRSSSNRFCRVNSANPKCKSEVCDDVAGSPLRWLRGSGCGACVEQGGIVSCGFCAGVRTGHCLDWIASSPHQRCLC